jgi:CheY-like chemotaxis protein
VLVADTDEIVAFIASHILSRYDFAVQTVTSADALAHGCNGWDAVVVSDTIAAQVAPSLDPARTVLLGKSIDGFKAFARLRKPLELDQLVGIVTACANRR